MKYAIAGTFAYLVLVISLALLVGEPPEKANEWGDYAAGFVAPVALVWFIGTLVLQRKELAMQRQELELQREEMKLTRGVLEEQAEMQLKTAEATLEANKISASTLFAESVSRREELFHHLIRQFGNVVPERIERPVGGFVSISKPKDVISAISYFEWLARNGFDIRNKQFGPEQRAALEEYVRAFSMFKDEAHEHGRMIDVFGSYHDLWLSILQFLGDDSVDR